MKLLGPLLLLFSLVSCGGSSGDGESKETLNLIKNFRSDISESSQIAPANKLIYQLTAPGSDATDWTDTNGTTFNYGNTTGLSLQGWFSVELDSAKQITGSGDNFFNRLDTGLLYMCAIFEDLGDDLDEQTTTITATADSINTNCGTNLPDQNISLTGESAVVTNLTSGSYEKKVEIDGMTIYVTNNDTELKVAYGLNEEEEGQLIGDRLVFSLNKTSENFQLEFMQYEGAGSETIYRAFKNTNGLFVFGRSPQGSKANYLATFTDTRVALDFVINTNIAKSVCLDITDGSKVDDTYQDCFDNSGDYDLSDVAAIIAYDLTTDSNTDDVLDWTVVNENTTINFSNAADFNTTTF